MIYWAPFLHFYQPSIQFHSVLKRICDECYRPLLKMFLEHPGAKVTINISGVLTELLSEHGAGDIIESIKQLAANGQLEFVDSGKYHPIFPLIPDSEAHRQIMLNRKTNESFFKKLYKPAGFFPPEMAYSGSVAKILKEAGYKWTLISGIACADTWPVDHIGAFSWGSSSFPVFYRDDILSNKVSFHNLDSVGFIKELAWFAKGKKDIYVITAMDAETFGHHVHHWEKLFLAQVYETISKISKVHDGGELKQRRDLVQTHKDIFSELEGLPDMKVAKISELLDVFPVRKIKPPKPSSWSTTGEDIQAKNYYPLWKDPGNPVHALQWEHLNLCFDFVDGAMKLKGKNDDAARFAIISRGILDRAVHSCQFWWANKARGTWDINLMNKALILQEETVLNAYKSINISDANKSVKKEYYHKVVACRDIAGKIRDLLLND